MTIEPVGNADYPFYGTLSGVTGTEKNLNGSVKTNTSAIHDVTITSNGQPDIGFFGHVTCLGDPAGTYTPSKVENMVFSDVKLKATEASVFDRLHKWFQGVLGKDDPNPHETNHLGIIAGHVTYSTMKDLSVYYSSSDVKAVEMSSPEGMNYLCGTGFFGLLDHLNPLDPQSDGGFNNEDFGAAGSDGGGSESGLNPGYINAEAMFKLGEGGTDGIVEITSLKNKKGELLVKLSNEGSGNPQKHYIPDGVFNFALYSASDTIQNIWPEEMLNTKKEPVSYFVPDPVPEVPRPYDPYEESEHETEETIPELSIPATEETVPETSVPATEETVPETSVPATEETVPETSTPATEETVPETTAPATEPEEKEVQVTFLKDPADLKLTIWRMVGDQKEYQVTIQEMEDLIMTTEEPTQEQIRNYLQLEEGSLVRQAQTDSQKPDLYLLTPDVYFFNADREGYVSVEERSFTVDPRSDSMKIEVTLEQAAPEETEAPTEAPTELPTEVPAEAPTEAATEAPTEAATEIPTETVAEEAAEVPEEIPAESALRGKNVLHLVSDGKVLPDLYFGNGDQIKLCSLSDVSYQIPIVTLPASSEPEEQTEAPAEKATEPAAMETVPEAEAPKEEETVPEMEAPAEEGTVPETEAPETAPTYPDMITPEAVPVPEQSSGTWKPQAPKATRSITATVKPISIPVDDVKITIYGTDGKEAAVSKSPSGDQNAIILHVPATEIKYKASYPGYATITGTQTRWNDRLNLNFAPLPQENFKFVIKPEKLTNVEIRVWSVENPSEIISPVKAPYAYKLYHGDYEFSVACAGFITHNGRFSVTANMKDILVTMKSAGTEVTFTTAPKDLSFTFWKEGDEGNQIICDSGNRTQNLAPGKYFYTASHPGYQTAPEGSSFKVGKNSPQDISIALQALPKFKMTFQCNYDAKALKVLDSSGNACQVKQINPQTYEAELYAGIYSYAAEPADPSYGKASGEFTVEQAGNVQIHFAKPEEVTFKGMPKGTTIQVWAAEGGQAIGDPIQVADSTCQLVPGEYVYVAQCSGYVTGGSVPFTVVKGTGAEVKVTLEKAAVITFTVQSQDKKNLADAQITVKSKDGGTEWKPQADHSNVFELAAGDYLYSVTCKGYTPIQDQPLTAAREEVKTVVVTMEKLPGGHIIFNCTPKDTMVEVYPMKDGVKGQKVEADPKTPHEYILEQGDYVYSVSKQRAKNLAAFQDIPLKVAAGDEKTISITLPKLGKAKFICDPADLTLKFYYMLNGEKIPYTPAKNGDIYRLPVGTCIFEGSKDNYENTGEISIQVTEAQKEFNVTLSMGVYPIPDTGPLPPMDAIGQKEMDKFWLVDSNAGDTWTWDDRVPTEGSYAIYLRKITSMKQIYSTPQNVQKARYLICPVGSEGLTAGREPAFLRLKNSDDFSDANFPADNAKSATIKDGKGVVPSKECGYQGPVDLVLSFGSTAERKQAMESIGLQIEMQPNSKYNIYQTDLENDNKYYLGICSKATDQWTNTLIRSLNKNLANGYTDSSAFQLEITGDKLDTTGDGRFMIKQQYAYNYKSLGYHSAKGNVGYNEFKADGNGNTEFYIYQVVAYDVIGTNFKGQWVPTDRSKAISLRADEYLLWREPEWTTNQGPATDTPYNKPYTIRRIGALGAENGWKLGNGQIIPADYKPNKYFNISGTTFMGNQWNSNKEYIIHVPLPAGGKVEQVPIGTLSFFVNTMKENPYIRVIVKVPTLTAHKSEAESILGVWQVAEQYWPNKPRGCVPLPISQPQSANNQQPSPNPLTVRYEGKEYQTYLQGETVLLATEFTLKKTNPMYPYVNGIPGPFFVAQTYEPLNPVYFAAEGVANGKPEISSGGNGSVELGNIDFVYDDGKLVTTVTDHEGSGASVYRRSDVLFQFMNIEGKTGSFKYNQVNEGWASIYRQYAGGGPVISLTKGGPDAPYMKINPTGENPDTIQQ